MEGKKGVRKGKEERIVVSSHNFSYIIVGFSFDSLPLPPLFLPLNLDYRLKRGRGKGRGEEGGKNIKSNFNFFKYG